MEHCKYANTTFCQNCQNRKDNNCKLWSNDKIRFNLFDNGIRVNINPMTIEELTEMQIHINKTYNKFKANNFYNFYKNMKKPKFEIVEVEVE